MGNEKEKYKMEKNKSFCFLHLASCLLFLVACFPLGVSGKDVRVDFNRGLAHMRSQYYTMSWYGEFPMMTFFGVESGGRSHHYCERNHLRPGIGSTMFRDGESSFGVKSSRVRVEENVIGYDSVAFRGGLMSMEVTAVDSRVFTIDIASKEGQIDGRLFRMAFAPDVVPLSVWSDKIGIAPSDEYDRPRGLFAPRVVKESNRLPAVLTFPDFGNVLVEASEPDVYLQEHMVPDWDNAGQNLGQGDLHGHKERKALHLGEIMLSFHAQKPHERVTLKFTVLEENYPHIAGVDLSDSRFDGLKRCWQNMFTLEPNTQTIGDDIHLAGYGHIALYFKADMLPFTPDYATSFGMRDGIRESIEYALRHMIDSATCRLRGFGYEGTESTIIATYDYIAATGDWAFLRKYMPQYCQLVKGVLMTDTDGDGILEDPYHGNYMGDKDQTVCWWDDFAFGHKNAYRNLLAYRALTGASEVFQRLGMAEEKAKVDSFLETFRSKFHQTFYNPASGLYAGWISRDGRIHDYAFTFVNATAIYLDLVPKARAKKLLKKMLKMLRREGFDFVYGVPGNIIPVDRKDRIGWDEMCRWGRYENGGLCGQTAYHFIQALYHVGMRAEADNILFTMMATFERDYTHSGIMPGYQQSIDWRTKGGEPSGYNYLAENYYFLLAAITGYYGRTIGPLPEPEQSNKMTD